MGVETIVEPKTHRLREVIGIISVLILGQLPLGTWSERLFGPLIGHEVLWWIAVLLVLAYVRYIEKRPFRSIGLKPFGGWDILSAIIIGVLMVVGIVVIYTRVFPALHLQMNTKEMGSLMSTPLWYRVMLVTRAAVSEELLFRAYPIERIKEVSGSALLAGFVSWATFTIAHLGTWGWAQLIVAGFGGVLLTGLYLFRRNLWMNMIAHWIADGAGFLT